MPTSRSRLGARGEDLARRLLEEKGYQVLGRNYRCSWGEIDIVAQDGDQVVFAEVRTRRNPHYGAPEESLTAAKVRHLIATAQEYLEQHGKSHADWRIDLVAVWLGEGHGEPRLRHWKNVVEQ